MSRSVRRNPFFGNACCNSEKKDRTICNRKLRRRANHLLMVKDSDEYLLPLQEEVMNVWSMGKDGKGYHKPKPRFFCGMYISQEDCDEEIKKAMRR